MSLSVTRTKRQFVLEIRKELNDIDSFLEIIHRFGIASIFSRIIACIVSRLRTSWLCVSCRQAAFGPSYSPSAVSHHAASRNRFSLRFSVTSVLFGSEKRWRWIDKSHLFHYSSTEENWGNFFKAIFNENCHASGASWDTAPAIQKSVEVTIPGIQKAQGSLW